MADITYIDVLLYLLTGAFAGFSAGLFGIGGGLIIVPVLYFVFSAQGIAADSVMHSALATSLASIVFTSVSSTLAHHKKHAVIWPLVWRLAPGIVTGAWLGGMAAARLDTAVLKPVFAVFELLVALHLLRRASPVQQRTPLQNPVAVGGGLTIGFISAIVGIGGGTLTVPFLHWHNIAMRHAVATSAACGLPIALFGAAAYVVSGWQANLPVPSLGYVNLPALGFIVITSYLCAPLGARLAHHLPEQRLKMAFALFLLALSMKMLLG